MRDVTLSDVERLRAESSGCDVALELDEEAFRGFYDRTARVLRAYLARITADRHLADDLLQEAYYRFLRARGTYESDAHRRNALFRIATNLAADNQRRARTRPVTTAVSDALVAAGDSGAAQRQAELRQAFANLRPRERQLLWLAYAAGWSHREIAQCLAIKPGSVRLLLFRARRRLAALLQGKTGRVLP